jgi:hypothetical protein
LRSEAPSAVRRIVTIDDDNGKSAAIHDGPTPDVRTDPARPGFASMRIWVTDTTPASIAHVRDPLALPHTLEPPPHGSVCRIVTVPPDTAFLGKVGASDRGVLSGHGVSGCIDLLAAGAASLHAEDAHARLLPHPGGRDHTRA